MENYEDLIAKYQILLESEKRRLATGLELDVNVRENILDKNNALKLDSNATTVEKCNDHNNCTSYDNSRSNREASLVSKTDFNIRKNSKEEIPEHDLPNTRHRRVSVILLFN